MEDTMLRVRPILETTPARWASLTKAISFESLSEAPAAGQWSALECLQHLIDVERVFQSRLLAFREGRDFSNFNPDEEGTQRKDTASDQLALDLADEFTRLRVESLRQLASITPDDYALRSRHSELGPVTLDQMLNEWAVHDLNHTVQAEEALMQPFIKACGPWRKYFTAHTIGG